MCPVCFSNLWAPQLVGRSGVLVTVSADAGTQGKP